MLPWKAPIAVLNHSTVLPDATAAAIVAALQVQVSRDYYPVWGLDAVVTFYPRGKPVPPTSWVLAFLDDADQAGALGYHETIADRPVGLVFVRTTLADGGSVSVTASHELLEMLGDPRINRAAIGSDPGGNPVVYAYENCDAVESDHIGYAIAGVLVSDFVTPAWFDPAAPKGSKFDFRGHCTAPFQVLAGGYIGVLTPRGWTQFTADGETHHSSESRYRGNRWHRRARTGRA